MRTIKIEDWSEIPTKFTGIVEFKNGTKEWYLDGMYHREDGPALEISDGTKFWYLYGQRHREVGPCTTCKDCLNGNFVLCTKPGPAAEYTNGKQWRLCGKLHREDGPAIDMFNGNKEWHLNGKLHREDGPAVECIDGKKYWYLNGKIVKKEIVELFYMLKYKKMLKP